MAVASNFFNPMKQLSAQFQRSSGHTLLLINGSTGKHYAQIINGAPFDLFFAADTDRPRRLEKEGLGVPGSRFTYAKGRLVLWSPKPGYVDSVGQILKTGPFQHLAIANPKLAPYGKAAQEVLEKQVLWHGLQGRLVRGESVTQTFQFIQSGAADLGFIAFAQISKSDGTQIEGSYWNIPQTDYSPILQEAILLKESAAAEAFLSFIKSIQGRAIIQSYGYNTP